MRNIFLEILYMKYDGKASPRPFYKKKKIKHISESTAWNAIKFAFAVCPSRDLPKYIKTNLLATYFYRT